MEALGFPLIVAAHCATAAVYLKPIKPLCGFMVNSTLRSPDGILAKNGVAAAIGYGG